jgi:hypothetical protein
MPKDIDQENALSQIEKENNLDVFFLSSQNSELEINTGDKATPKKFKTKKIRSIENFKSSKKYASIWIDKKDVNNYFGEGNEKNIGKIQTILSKGYTTVFFLEPENVDELRKTYTGYDTKVIEDANNNQKPYIFYISKNKAGEYFTGVIYSHEMNNEVLKSALASSWNRRNDWKYTRKTPDIKKSNVAYAEGGATFSIGSTWRCVRSWELVEYSTTFRGGVAYNDKGRFSEWRGVFYCTNSVDGKDYYAYATEVGMLPVTGSTYCDKFWYQSESNAIVPDAIRNYQPRAVPSESTYTFNVGAGIAKDGLSGNGSLSWTYTKKDLQITDQTSSSYYMSLYFNYPFTILGQATSYAKQSNWNNISYVVQNSTNRGYTYINYRSTWSFGDLGWSSKTYQASSGASIYVRK